MAEIRTYLDSEVNSDVQSRDLATLEYQQALNGYLRLDCFLKSE